MAVYKLFGVLICVANNLVRVFAEVAVIGFSTFNLSSDIAQNLYRNNASVLEVISQLPNVLILLSIGLGTIDWNFNYRHWLLREFSFANQKAILASELPHVILKAAFLAWLNINFFLLYM
ncbi:MAG: hypothetical protein RLZZ511_4110 [Cyanobacteriota bacterium]|jgi:hypothetical protein